MEQNSEVMEDVPEESMSRRRFIEIIERIEQVRRYLGLNRSKFCRSIGMSPQTYNNFIGPQGTKPNIQLLHGVVTRFGVDPMWLFTGRGNMFLSGFGEKPGLQARLSSGVAESGAFPNLSLSPEMHQELVGLTPVLRRIESVLQSLDRRHEPLLERFTDVFKRYLRLHPEMAVSEIVAFLEGMERRLAQDAAPQGAAVE